MSRKRRSRGKGHQPGEQRHFTIPLADWKRYLRFKDLFSQFEEVLDDLQDQWGSHVNYLQEELRVYEQDFEEVSETIQRFAELLNTVKNPPIPVKSGNNGNGYLQPHQRQQQQKTQPKILFKEKVMAEIYIEDISDGSL